MHNMQRKHKVHSLTGRITEKLMKQSFKAVKRNRGAAGIDKVSVKMFEANLEEKSAGVNARPENRQHEAQATAPMLYSERSQ